MMRSTSAVAFCCSSNSSRSRLSSAFFVLALVLDGLRRPLTFGAGALCLRRRASPVFHGIAARCGRAHSGHAAAATPRIPGKPRRFMIAPGSGDGIVSAQTNALEGAQTGFVGLLQQDI